MEKIKLKRCPICGSRKATFHEYYESCDGRADKPAYINCSCGLELHLTGDEFWGAQDKYNYKGGYYSQNKKFWEGMHQMLVDKWNNMACANIGDPNNHNVTVGELMDILKGVYADTEVAIPVIDKDDANKIYALRPVRTIGLVTNANDSIPILCLNTSEDGMDFSDQIASMDVDYLTCGTVYI